MSLRIWLARSHLFLPTFWNLGERRFTQRWSKAAGIGSMLCRKSFMLSNWSRSSTPAVLAASYRLPPKISQPVKTRSSSCAIGAQSLISGVRSSVRFPSRIVPICEVDPNGLANPLRTASTPAISVVATAPIPGIIIPSFPVAGLMLAASGDAALGVDIAIRTLPMVQISVRFADSSVSLFAKPCCK